MARRNLPTAPQLGEPNITTTMAGEPITEDMVLEYSGERLLGDVRELVLRDGNLARLSFTEMMLHFAGGLTTHFTFYYLLIQDRFAEGLPAKLGGLETISLSHNKFVSLEAFTAYDNLVSLNLNFNDVGTADLRGLRNCAQLAKLFLSSNRVASVAPLVPLKALETLCLFRNSIPAADFSRTLEDLGTLPKLAELDLDGNPCAKGKGFKHHVVMALPRLCQLVRLSCGAR